MTDENEATVAPHLGKAESTEREPLMANSRAMQAGLEALTRLVERAHAPGPEIESEESTRRSHVRDLKLTKFSEATDDIEAYLTTFERLATIYEVDITRWAYLLAPQLTGKAQQAYAGCQQLPRGPTLN